MPTITMIAGGKALPVEVSRERKKLAFRFRNFPPLREAIKAMKGAEFERDPARWLVTDCERNRIWIERLQNKTPKQLARYDLPLENVEPRRTNLRAHQRAMLNFLVTRRRCILAAEMGTGKTLPTIEAMERVPGEWWYVSKSKVLDSIKIEFEKWKSPVRPRFITFNVLKKTLEKHSGKAPRGVVFDEASFLKGKGPWYEAAQHLADGVREDWGDDGYVFELTGSPSPKDPCDWHSLAEIACPGFLREATVSQLRRRLAVIEMQEGGERAFPKIVEWRKDEVERLGRRLEGLVWVVRAAECQELPPLREEIVELKPSADLLRAARLVANTSLNAAQALNKVRQLSDGFQYRDDGTADRCPSPKDDALASILERNEQVGRVIIFAPYTESIDRAVDVCLANGWNVIRCDGRGWACLDGKVDTGRVEEWLKNLDRSLDPNTVEKLAFVGHPNSGGFGLNLTAAREGVYFSSDFDWGAHIQSKKRGHREGMDLAHGFTFYYLCHLPTDKYVLANHDKKRTLQSYTLDEIRRVLS